MKTINILKQTFFGKPQLCRIFNIFCIILETEIYITITDYFIIEMKNSV